MTINNPESYRTLTFEGVGTQFEIKRFTYLNRFRKGELLERDEWEYEYDEDFDIEGGATYEYLKIYLKNILSLKVLLLIINTVIQKMI